MDAKGSREERAAAEQGMAESTNLESLSYALFVVNSLYLVGVRVCGWWLLLL